MMKLLVAHRVHVSIANLIAVMAYSLVNFLLGEFFVFRERPPASPANEKLRYPYYDQMFI
jgi:putative flippase GtrA